MTFKIRQSAYTPIYIYTIYIDGDFGVSERWMDGNNRNFDCDPAIHSFMMIKHVIENPL